MAATTEHLMSTAATQSPEPKDPHFDPLAFLNKINGLLMAVAIAAWGLLGSEYRGKVADLEASQRQTTAILLKRELEIRVDTAKDEHQALRTQQADLEARLRQVEQSTVRTEPKPR